MPSLTQGSMTPVSTRGLKLVGGWAEGSFESGLPGQNPDAKIAGFRKSGAFGREFSLLDRTSPAHLSAGDTHSRVLSRAVREIPWTARVLES